MARRAPPIGYIADLALVLGTAVLFAYSTATADVRARDTPPASRLMVETRGDIAASIADRSAWEGTRAARPVLTDAPSSLAASAERAPIESPAPARTTAQFTGDGPPAQQLLHSRPDDARAYIMNTAESLRRRAWIGAAGPQQYARQLGAAWIGHADAMQAIPTPLPAPKIAEG